MQRFIYLLTIFISLVCSCSSASVEGQDVSHQKDSAPLLDSQVPSQLQTTILDWKWPVIIGATDGLYAIDRWGVKTLVWQGGTVYKVLRTSAYWAILTEQGIFVSTDMATWEERNAGLPVKTIKVYENKVISFVRVMQDIKDLEIHPDNPEIMVCAVKDAVFISRDAGRTWKSLATPHTRTDGIKAVAVADMPELTVFAAHNIYGLSYLLLDKPGAVWTNINAGLEKLETTDNPDEISDVAVITAPGTDTSPTLYAAQTFRGRVYRLDWKQKRFFPVWSDNQDFSTVDSLDVGKRGIRFVQEGAIVELNTAYSWQRPDLVEFIQSIPETLAITPMCLLMWENVFNPDSELINLSELWLLSTEPEQVSAGKEGLYIPLGYALSNSEIQAYLNLLEKHNLDMIVIDMKDDYGRLRFTPNNPELLEKGRVFSPMEIDSFVHTMKEHGIYTVARIVTFKDPEVAKKDGGRFAVWDARTGGPWVGYNESTHAVYDERWADPYSEEVWEYNTAVAVELYERGFDEIQFDYIRFPTDGANLADARFRWQGPGMDRDSALISFLRHVRARLAAPISVDIYGSNGWYRTASRTGQDVELLSRYVDVICPMYYPSHFEQYFLAQAPAEQRPYRIYYYGTLRTRVIARNAVVVRSWAQAFRLNVSYDRQYYGKNYIQQEVDAVHRAGTGGFTYWNNSGRYEDIP
jgi:hypothetical protein